MHLLGANKGRQLRGFRGLFNKSSKSSVDTHIGVPPRKRSITDHLLRRTASAPAKGRKKIKMPLTEATSDRKHSTGDPQTTCVERRAGNRKALQHRPASMPLDKLLHSHLSLSTPDREGPDPGADTVIDSFLSEKPRSISVDLLFETSAFKEPDVNALSADHIQDCNIEPKDTKETPYLVIEGSRESLGNPNQEHSRGGLTQTEADKLCSSKGPADHLSGHTDQCNGGSSSLSEVSHRELSQLEAPKKNILTAKAATYSLTSSSSLSSGTITKFSPRMTLPDQKSQVSLQDSALSRLIDAVSLENEYDTCGSISALIGQFELTAEQSSLIPFNSQPMKNYIPSSDLPHLNTELSSTPLKVIQKSVCVTSELTERPSSPETTEPAVFTILDEEVLSPVPTKSLCQTNFHNDLVGSHVVSKRSSPNKMALEWSARGNLKQNYSSECHSTGSFRNFEFGGYRETSINSTPSDRFLLCQDSASSSLMEVEINVDGDPLDNTPTHLSPFHGFKSVHSLNQTSPYHVQRLEPTHLHKPSYNPSPVHSYSTDTSLFHRHYQSPHQSLNSSTYLTNKLQRRKFNCYNDSGRFTLGDHRIDDPEGRHQETRDQNSLVSRAEHIHKSSLTSECLAKTQGCHNLLKRDLYTPVSDYNMISVESQDSYTQPSSHNQAFPVPPPQLYNGLSPASSKSKSLGDLTSEDISCNFQSKYKSISRSFVTPAMKDQRRICGLSGRPKSTDPLTEQLRKLVTLENEDYARPLPSCSQLIPKPLSVLPLVSQSSADDPEDPPPFLSRRLSSRSQSRVRHIANRARERQQEAFKHRPVEGAMEVVLRNKPVSSQNPPLNRHSTGSYIAGYLDQLGPEARGLPEGACTSLRYGYGDRYYNDDSVLPPDFSNSSEPEVFFLLRL
ncbi:1-phosphatidylinositol 4,5-bisphosphate phosphodiesterase eta-1-like [Sinocyclocheilus rhinocerous]|uniref:1-phosphatidylinositol 4,5-bisphosphate phosphodiesterase eta-1-like n=1 Tax=Sinocyclocheilus rhinocerous TaxID=307959 RepID=UPI0007B8B1D9|nr:PREDICTED: 1-phosphatidylinositol 4,5-bisphosphate phosphodiesterase eta-1-like [Sinocyclocheilus rhinocerous]